MGKISFKAVPTWGGKDKRQRSALCLPNVAEEYCGLQMRQWDNRGCVWRVQQLVKSLRGGAAESGSYSFSFSSRVQAK